MISAKQVWFLMMKPQFSALHMLTFSGLLTLLVLNLHGSYDPSACARLLHDDLGVLCQQHSGQASHAPEAKEFLKTPPQHTGQMLDPEPVLPAKCYDPPPKS